MSDAVIEIYNLEMKLIHAIKDIEDYGCKIDLNFLNELQLKLSTEIKSLEEQAKSIDNSLNIGSPAQLVTWFLGKGVKIPEKAPEKSEEDELEENEIDSFIGKIDRCSEKDTRYSVDSKVLKNIDHHIARIVEKYRKAIKFKSTYVDALLDSQIDNVIHPDFRTIQARTGRLSCSRPPLQCIPNDPEDITEEQRKELVSIRRAFIPREGCRLFPIDYSQQEYRLFVHYTGDESLIKLYKEDNVDFHTVVAALINGITEKDVTREQRKRAKTCIAEGELVLTDKGKVPIECVTLKHKVWDGLNFVEHSGLLYKGVQKVIFYDGLWATPDHEVFLEKGGTCTFEDAYKKRLYIARGIPESSAVVCSSYSRKNPLLCKNKKVFDIVNAGPLHSFTVSNRVVSNCNFGILYGMGPDKLSKSLGCTEHEAKKIMKGYFENIKGSKHLIEHTKQTAFTRGYVKTLFGRPRYLHYIDRNGKEINETHKALNTIIQGSAADIMKIMLVKINTFLKNKQGVDWDYPYGVRCILSIHDEIILEVPYGQEGLIPLVKDALEYLPMVKVPMLADVSICESNWSDKKKVTNEEIAEWRRKPVKLLKETFKNPYSILPIVPPNFQPTTGLFKNVQ